MKIEIPLGTNAFGQDYVLTGLKAPNNKMVYELTQLAANQRDDTVTIRNITPEIMDRLLSAVPKIKAAAA